MAREVARGHSTEAKGKQSACWLDTQFGNVLNLYTLGKPTTGVVGAATNSSLRTTKMDWESLGKILRTGSGREVAVLRTLLTPLACAGPKAPWNPSETASGLCLHRDHTLHTRW